MVRMSRPRRGVPGSPAWGPVAVTSVPSTSTTPASGTTSRASHRRAGTGSAGSGAPARSASTTATAIRAVETRKWPATTNGLRSVSTVMPPSTAWPRTPPTRPQASPRRSRRCGASRRAAHTAHTAVASTTKVRVRLPNSTNWCQPASAPPRGTTEVPSQVGQCSQPRPDPVIRTIPPVSTIPTLATSADSAAGRSRGNAAGEVAIAPQGTAAGGGVSPRPRTGRGSSRAAAGRRPGTPRRGPPGPGTAGGRPPRPTGPRAGR